MNCPSLRIASLNEADSATLTTSPTAVPTLPVSNLKTDIKNEVCRINSGNATIQCDWSTPRHISCVGIPACNLSSESEYRLQVYSGPGTGLLHDTDWQWGAPGPIFDNWDWTQPFNVNSFDEGSTIVGIWLPEHYMVRRLVLQLRDPDRPYLDISRFFAGPDFRPRYGVSYGTALGIEDLTTVTRAASGDLRPNPGPRIQSPILDINHIHAADRHRYARILQQGVGKYHFISAFPDAADVSLAQDYMAYGVIEVSPLVYAYTGGHSTQYVIRRF